MAKSFCLLTPEEAALYEKNARWYGPAEARRLNVYAVVAHHHIKEGTFRKRQKQLGWPSLGGKKLAMEKTPFAGVPKGWEPTYLEADVIRALQPVQGDEWLRDTDGTLRVTHEQVMAELCVSNVLLWRWNKDGRCPYIDNEPLASKIIKNPATSGRVRTYSRADVDRIKAKMAEVQSGRWMDNQGRVWLQRDRLCRVELCGLGRYDSNACDPYPRPTLHCWINHKTRHNGWKKLTAKRMVFKTDVQSTSAVGTKDLWYLEEDILRIKASLIAARARRISRESEPPASRRNNPVWDFNGIWEESTGRRFSISRAAKEAGMSKGRLWRWAKGGLPPELKLQDVFPGNKLPLLKRLVPGSKNHWMPSIHERDLQTLRKAIEQALHETYIAPDEKTGNEICDHYGIAEGHHGRAIVHLFLQALRGTDVLAARQVLRACAGKRRWSRPWLYNLSKLDELLGAREIVEVARTFLADLERPCEASEPTPATAAQPKGQHAGKTASTKRKRGRPTKERTQDIYARCFRLFRQERHSRSEVMTMINDYYEDDVIKEPSEVLKYSNRHVENVAKAKNLQNPRVFGGGQK